MGVSEVVIYISVFLLSMLKFIPGLALGVVSGLTSVEVVIFTVLGMMSSVVLITLFGKQIKRLTTRLFNRKQKKFSPRNRRIVYIWRKYGFFGVSFLTPILFTPIGGALLANAMGEPRKKIISYMLISSIFWSLAFSQFVHFVF